MVAVHFVRIRVALVMQPVVGVTELVGIHEIVTGLLRRFVLITD